MQLVIMELNSGRNAHIWFWLCPALKQQCSIAECTMASHSGTVLMAVYADAVQHRHQ